MIHPVKHRAAVWATLFVASVAPYLGLAAGPEAKRPNIVFFFMDDWAWNGSPVAMDDRMPNSRMPVLRMPNVEKLARDGMKFRNAYASPQCSPSRVCVQTGMSSPRSGFTVFMNDGGQDYYNEKQYKGFPVIPCVSDMTIDRDAVTIPEALKPLGYVCAHIGKWHMRGDPGEEGNAVHDGDTTNTRGNPHYRTSMPHSAIVSGSKKVMHFYEHPEIPMLFDLAQSDGEVENVATKHSEEHQRLYNEMMRYLKEVGARMPKPNPDYDPEIYRRDKSYASRLKYGAFEGKRELEDDEH